MSETGSFFNKDNFKGIPWYIRPLLPLLGSPLIDSTGKTWGYKYRGVLYITAAPEHTEEYVDEYDCIDPKAIEQININYRERNSHE